MNRTNSKSTRPSKAAEHRRTPKRWPVVTAPKFRQVLECAAAAALWNSHEVMDRCQALSQEVANLIAQVQRTGAGLVPVKYVCPTKLGDEAVPAPSNAPCH